MSLEKKSIHVVLPDKSHNLVSPLLIYYRSYFNLGAR